MSQNETIEDALGFTKDEITKLKTEIARIHTLILIGAIERPSDTIKEISKCENPIYVAYITFSICKLQESLQRANLLESMLDYTSKLIDQQPKPRTKREQNPKPSESTLLR